jgi:hypothetical protein
MIEFYEARRDTRWDVYPQVEPLQLVSVERFTGFAIVRHQPSGRKAIEGMIPVRLLGALFS